MLIDFFRKYKILCVIFAVMLLLVAVTAILIVREMRRQDMTADKLLEVLGSEDETAILAAFEGITAKKKAV